VHDAVIDALAAAVIGGIADALAAAKTALGA